MSPLLVFGLNAALASSAAVAPPPHAAQAESAGPSYNGLSTKLSLGASYQRLFTVPIYSAELAFALGGRAGRQAGYFAVHFQRGETEFGLNTWGVHAGPSTEWAFDRLRLGGALRVGFLSLDRVTAESSLSSASAGGSLHASVDFVSWASGEALYLEAAGRLDAYADAPIVLGPSLCLGYRWQANSRLAAPDPAR